MCSTQEGLRNYLSRLLESYGLEVVSAGPLQETHLASLDPDQFDLLLIDSDADTGQLPADLTGIIERWDVPVLINDSVATAISLHHADPNFGEQLMAQINTLLGRPANSITTQDYQ